MLAAESRLRFDRLPLGAALQGEVVRRLGDGSSLVRVADVVVRMRLPEGAGAGDTLPMRLLSRAPQLAFGIGSASIAALVVSAQQALLAGTPAPLPAGAQLSEGAKLVQAALRHAGTSAVPIGAAAALVDSPQAPPGELAQALQGRLARSGLFYESHVARWAQGRYPLPELRQEPQAQSPPLTPANAEAQPAALERIAAQLAVLEQGRLAWQGEAWPGQQMHWSVARDEEEREAAREGGAEPVWQSRLRIALPRLGEIDASLQLAGGRLRLLIDAGQADAAELLRGSAGELAEALREAGIPLDHLAIRRAGDGP